MKRRKNTLTDILKKFSLSNLISLALLVIIIGGIVTSIYMDYVDRSLWADEAMLAYSFSKRSFFQLCNGQFELLQSAPLGWLYFEKSLSVLFDNTEFVLRIGSILGYSLTIIVLYYLLKHLSVSRVFCFSACAFYANIPFILKYSNVFKPYIFDGFIVLFAILGFRLFEQERIHAGTLTIIWVGLIWFSTPVCFIEGGLLLAATLEGFITRDLRKLKVLFVLGVSIVISFLAFYFFWMGDKTTLQGMHAFWKGQNFPMIPTALDELNKMRTMTLELYWHFGINSIPILIIMLLGIPVAIKEKQTAVIGSYFGIFLSLFASWINMFPIEDRLWCFFYPLSIFLAFYYLNYLSKGKSKYSHIMLCLVVGLFFYPYFGLRGIALAFLVSYVICELLSTGLALNIRPYVSMTLSIVLVFSVHGISQYLNNSDEVYWNGQELNTEVNYLNENLKSDEYVYVFYYSVAGFQYKNGYDTNSIAGYNDNIIYGKGLFMENEELFASLIREGDYDMDNEIKNIIEKDKIYIASAHVVPGSLDKLVEAMHEEGYFQLVLYEHATPLWFFCRNLEDSKIHVSYETISIEDDGGECIVKVLLHNNGPGYINHQYEEVCLVNTSTGEKCPLPKNIMPGSSIELALSYSGNPPVFRLENENGLICTDSDYTPET